GPMLLGLARLGEGLDQPNNLRAKVFVFDGAHRAGQFQGLAVQRLAVFARCAIQAFKEVSHGDAEDSADVPKAAPADAVGAALVLLHLLKAHAQFLSELALAHAQRYAALTQAAANVDIGFVVHLRPFPSMGKWLWL